MRSLRVILCSVAVLLSGCGYNAMQQQDEGVKAAWAEVLNQYQRRADLVPNLVNTVKGLRRRSRRCSSASPRHAPRPVRSSSRPELSTIRRPSRSSRQAQGELTQALKSLFAVTENYPQLKSDANFRDLQAQIEGTENRITVARNRYIQAVRIYNITVRSFPTNLTAMLFKQQVKPSFTVEDEAAVSKAPTVDFSAPAPAK